MNYEDALKVAEKSKNYAIFDSFIKADNIINHRDYKNIFCSISGGSDSDIVMDIIQKVDKDKKVKYVWFNTGLEYKATRKHLKFLEDKYQVKILRERAIKPIPYTCKKRGQPFLSKYVSEQIMRLQSNGFNWEDGSFEELYNKYPKAKSCLKWWTNEWTNESTKENNFKKVSRFAIGYNKLLKEFLMKYPPTFKISNLCCYYAKKNVAHYLCKNYDIDLQIIGVRQSEGGIRSVAYKNCFSKNDSAADMYRPIFFYKDKDKLVYEKLFDVTHSDCYTVYGMTRTGCAGCPFNRKFEDEMSVIEQYETNLYKAINNIFKESYEYTKKYREFLAQNKLLDEQLEGQMSLFDYV